MCSSWRFGSPPNSTTDFLLFSEIGRLKIRKITTRWWHLRWKEQAASKGWQSCHTRPGPKEETWLREEELAPSKRPSLISDLIFSVQINLEILMGICSWTCESNCTPLGEALKEAGGPLHKLGWLLSARPRQGWGHLGSTKTDTFPPTHTSMNLFSCLASQPNYTIVSHKQKIPYCLLCPLTIFCPLIWQEFYPLNSNSILGGKGLLR